MPHSCPLGTTGHLYFLAGALLALSILPALLALTTRQEFLKLRSLLSLFICLWFLKHAHCAGLFGAELPEEPNYLLADMLA